MNRGSARGQGRKKMQRTAHRASCRASPWYSFMPQQLEERAEAQRRASDPSTKGEAQAHDESEALKQACFQAYPESAVCVQSPVGSRNSAIYNVYHTSLRPSSLFEPRHPSLKVVKLSTTTKVVGVCKMMIEFSIAR